MAAAADLGDGHRQPGPHRRRLPEVFLTSQADNKLQTLGGRCRTTRRTTTSPSSAASPPSGRTTGGDVLPSTAWHPEFADVNNDGFADLFVTKGNVEAQVDHATRDPSNLLIGQPDGTFVEGGEEAGIVDYERAAAPRVVDLNLDGLLDLVVVNRRANVTLWRNVGRGDAEQPAPMGHWIDVRLQQPAPERRRHRRVGRGARRRPHERRARSPSAAATSSGELGWLHTGLGSADERRGACAVARRHASARG